MNDPYYSPEKFGLRTVGEVQWGEACYSFDLTVVWQDVITGALYYADDSGCSCPSPFEDIGRDKLIPIDRPQTFIDHVGQRVDELASNGYSSEAEVESAKADSGALVLKVREALS